MYMFSKKRLKDEILSEKRILPIHFDLSQKAEKRKLSIMYIYFISLKDDKKLIIYKGLLYVSRLER